MARKTDEERIAAKRRKITELEQEISVIRRKSPKETLDMANKKACMVYENRFFVVERPGSTWRRRESQFSIYLKSDPDKQRREVSSNCKLTVNHCKELSYLSGWSDVDEFIDSLKEACTAAFGERVNGNE